MSNVLTDSLLQAMYFIFNPGETAFKYAIVREIMTGQNLTTGIHSETE